MDYNGGSVVAMVGKECVAIACDLRLGNQALGVANDFEKVRVCIRPITVYMSVECRQVDQRDGLGGRMKVSCLLIWKTHQIFPITDRMYLGLPGLATDVYTLCVHLLSSPLPLRHPPSTISSHTLLNLHIHIYHIT
jgi:20S proteasome subunit beta 3